MTIQELIDYLTKNCPDKNKLVLLHETVWEQDESIDYIGFDEVGNLVLYH